MCTHQEVRAAIDGAHEAGSNQLRERERRLDLPVQTR